MRDPGDKYICKFMAETAMGWVLKTGVISPQSKHDMWEPKDSESDMEGCFVRKWVPYSNLNQAMECAKNLAPKMEESFYLAYYKNADVFVFYIYGFGRGEDESPARAVCLALIDFVESGK